MMTKEAWQTSTASAQIKKGQKLKEAYDLCLIRREESVSESESESVYQLFIYAINNCNGCQT